VATENKSLFARIWEIPELKQKILFTLTMLAVYRIGVFVTLPGVNRNAMAEYFTGGEAAGFLGLFNTFSGDAIKQLSVFALGIMPYISASIVFQILTVAIPTLDRLNKEGEQGRKKINQWTRYSTIVLALFQGYFISTYLESLGNKIVLEPGLTFRMMSVLTLTTGTAFIMWLGEQITERGIGNGMSLIIFAGIVSGLPDALWEIKSLEQATLLFLMAFVVGVILFIVFMERAQYRIPIQYTKRVVGNRAGATQTSYLPLRVNMAGVIPPIFASSLLIFPSTLASWAGTGWLNTITDALVPGTWTYMVVFSALTIFFCYFYTAVMFNPSDVAENLKRQGGSVPGIRPGQPTADYIDSTLTRLTFAGGLYVALVCVVPMFIQDQFKVSFYFGGTSLLIVVSVCLDTIQQIETHLYEANYSALSDMSDAPKLRDTEAI
jgi:preprotein translocase subunit SecY